MTDNFSLIPLICGTLLAACIMYTVKNSRLRDKQGKFLGFMIVVLAVGVLVIVSGYRGIISNPFGHSYDTNSQAQKITPSTIVSGISNNGDTDSSRQNSLANEAQKPYIYGIMFDAGSTGSRIHVFKFKEEAPGKPFAFVDELFIKLQPGLSSYADHPKEAAASLKPMLDQAKEYIPENQWKTTPVALKATAGLRKLQKEEADNILNEVRQLFVDYPFQQADDSVVIMEGTDEGVFSWFTVNFYSGVLGDSDQMQGVMDLGGGSTQITFTPSHPDTISTAPASYINETNILGKKFKLYTHSYLDLGLMAGRLQTMGGKVGVEAEQGAPLPTLISPCFPEDFVDKIEFGQDEYTVKGVAPKTSRHKDCLAAARKVISGYTIHSSVEITKKPFCAISYYYDRAVEAGLMDGDDGIVDVGEFSGAAEKVCAAPKKESPYLCLDLCYISALLQDGFKMTSDNSLSIRKKIKGEEISWALGAMFDFIEHHPVQKR